MAPELVLVWQDVEDVLLAHIVARELGVGVVRAYDADGVWPTPGRFLLRPESPIVTDLVRDDTAGPGAPPARRTAVGRGRGHRCARRHQPRRARPTAPPVVALVSPDCGHR